MHKNIFLSLLICSAMIWQKVTPGQPILPVLQTPAAKQLLSILQTDNVQKLEQFIQDNPTFNWRQQFLGYGDVTPQAGIGGALYFGGNISQSSVSVQVNAHNSILAANSGSHPGNVVLACIICNAPNCLNYLLAGNFGNIIGTLQDTISILNVATDTQMPHSLLDYASAYTISTKQNINMVYISQDSQNISLNQAPFQARSNFIPIIQQIETMYQQPVSLGNVTLTNLVMTLNSLLADDNSVGLQAYFTQLQNTIKRPLIPGQPFPLTMSFLGLPWPNKQATIFTAAVWFNAINCLTYLLTTFSSYIQQNGALNILDSTGHSPMYYATNSFYPNKSTMMSLLGQYGGIVLPRTAPA